MQSMQDIINLIRRRIVIFLLTSIPVFIIVAVIAFILPPIYVSRSTILIESQQIPQEYVRTTVTGYVEQRLEAITQQILSRANLLNIINQFNLYSEMRKKFAPETAIEKMRRDINIETISADRRRGRDTTVAFTLSYEGGDPTIVQMVAKVVTDLYLEENVKRREAQATRTTEFLQQELNNLKEQIDDYATKISDFKKAHIGELPEYSEVNAQALEQLRRDLDQAESQINSLEERKVYLDGQLAGLKTSGVLAVEGEGAFDAGPYERLKSLRLQLISLQSRVSEKHPDLVKLKREIKKLESQTGGVGGGLAGEKKRLDDLKNELAALRSRLGSGHPDVVKLQREVANLSDELNKAKGNPLSTRLTGESSSNPVYINLKTQRDTINLKIKHLVNEKRNMKKKMYYYQTRIEKGPLVEKEYESLVTDYDNAKQKYNEIMSKLMEATVARGMEQTQHGERFTIIEPANKPEDPEKPNRKKVLMMGLFLAICAGGGLAYVQEIMDHSIKTAHELDAISHIPVLSSIPMMATGEEKKQQHKNIILMASLAVGGMCVLIIALHFLYMPLDILWLKIQKKFMIRF